MTSTFDLLSFDLQLTLRITLLCEKFTIYFCIVTRALSVILIKCKERGFIPTWISAPLPASNQASIPAFQSRKIYKSISGIFPLPVSQNKRKYTHLPLIVVLHCYRSIWANICRNTYFSQCNLVSRLYVLRSVRNLHHRKDLLLARRF